MREERKRGLKIKVAPLAGAWIEMSADASCATSNPVSLPSRERGLKLTEPVAVSGNTLSLPSRERGLK